MRRCWIAVNRGVWPWWRCCSMLAKHYLVQCAPCHYCTSKAPCREIPPFRTAAFWNEVRKSKRRVRRNWKGLPGTSLKSAWNHYFTTFVRLVRLHNLHDKCPSNWEHKNYRRSQLHAEIITFAIGLMVDEIVHVWGTKFYLIVVQLNHSFFL